MFHIGNGLPVHAYVPENAMRNRVFSWILAAVLAAQLPQALSAQEPFFPADPEQMLDAFFGPQTAQERNRLEAVEVSWQEESRFGEQAVRAFLQQLKHQQITVTSRGPDVEKLRRLAETVRPQMRNADRYRRLRIYIAESSATDARCFPGGTLVFFRGLLDFAPDDATLVGVIGHELSHLDHGHQLVHLRGAKLAQETFSGRQSFDPARFFRGGVQLMRVFGRPFRPEDEAQADRDGATWAYRAGYDPRALAQLFLRWQQRDQQQRDRWMAYFRTHPYHQDRYEDVMEVYRQLQRDEPRVLRLQ